METNSQDLIEEQKEALCSLLPQLLSSTDRLRFTIKQMRKKGVPSFVDSDDVMDLQIHYEESLAILSRLITSLYE